VVARMGSHRPEDDDNTINEALLEILTDSGASSNEANGNNFFNVVTTSDPSQSQGMRTRRTSGRLAVARTSDQPAPVAGRVEELHLL
jgi:hypothetical protein